MSALGDLPAACVFVVHHNGAPFIVDGQRFEHTTMRAGWDRAKVLAEEYRSALTCFSVEKESLR